MHLCGAVLYIVIIGLFSVLFSKREYMKKKLMHKLMLAALVLGAASVGSSQARENIQEDWVTLEDPIEETEMVEMPDGDEGATPVAPAPRSSAKRPELSTRLGKFIPPPLHLAAKMGNAFQVRRLLDTGISANARDKYGNTALHYAWRENVAKVLVARGADIEAKNNAGGTPLHTASARPAIRSVARYLVGKGANVNATDKDGATPMHVAAAFGQMHHVRLYHSKGGDVNARNNRGFTPMHAAVGTGRLSKFDIRMMVAGGVAEAAAVASLGAAIAIPVAAFGSVGAVAVAAVSAPVIGLALVGAAAGGSLVVGVLFAARAIDRKKTVNALLELGADINAQDNLGNTPLHMMAAGRALSPKAMKGGPFLARHMMENGARVNIRNKKGKTAYDVAKAFARVGLMHALAPGQFGREVVAGVKSGVKRGAGKVKGAFQEAKRRHATKGARVGVE